MQSTCTVTEHRTSACYSRFIMQRLDTRIQDLEKETDFLRAAHLYGRAQFTVSTQTEPHPAQKERPFPKTITKGCSGKASKAVNLSPLLPPQSRLISVRSQVKNLPASAGDIRDVGWISGSGKIPWRREWQLTLVFLPRESHGQKSLAGYSPQGR